MDTRLAVRALLLDIDGTLYQDGAALPGAVEVVARVREAGMPFRLVTNTSRRSRRDVSERLRALGFAFADDELVTAAYGTARWLRARGIRSLRLYAPDSTRADFDAFELDAETPEAIVVGDLGEAWTYERLNGAFRDLLGGARLVAMQRNRYWRKEGELVLDAGPFVAALEYATGQPAVVVGKPSVDFFGAAAEGLPSGAGAVAMVGDDLESDVGGAQAAGLVGILVRTGKFREELLQTPGTQPDAVIDSISELPALLGL